VRAIAQFRGATYYAIFGRGIERWMAARKSDLAQLGLARERISSAG
jgi:hypothetical protein